MIRATTPEDVLAADEIYRFAKANFKALGIDQWQFDYPDAKTITQDIADGVGYVLEVDGCVVGVSVYTVGAERLYSLLEGGSWLTDGDDYLTIHRIAIAGDRKGEGLSKQLMAYGEDLARLKGCPSVRVDTHPDNKVMQGLIDACGYTYCGIYVVPAGEEKGSTRLCYEKVL